MQSPAQGGPIAEANSDSFHLSTPLWIGCEALSKIYLPFIQSSQTKIPPYTPPPFTHQIMDTLTSSDIAFNQFNAGTDLHQYEIIATNALTISAVTDLGQDVSLTLVDTMTDQMVGQNLIQGKEVETAVFTNLNPAHTYDLNINNPPQSANNYIILVWGDGDELLWMEGEINNVLLPQTGLYTLWLEEFDYEMADYTLTVVKE